MREYREVLTPIPEIKRMARRYSLKYHVPIRISASVVEELGPDTEALYHYHYNRKGKIVSTIYLHPDLQYESRAHVDSTVRHEIAHLGVERRWEDRL